jgi:L-asparaginase II
VESAPPVLLDVSRNGFIESHHRGSFVLLEPGGELAVAAGAPATPIFPRSSLKPLQTIAMIECGFPGRDGALALAAASHNGERVHVEGAAAILAAAGLDERALQCPPDLPTGDDAMLAHVRRGGRPERICHSCSGKHAAMVATCAVNGWDVSRYCDLDHPLQIAVRATIERLTAETITASGVDGCGAPAYAVSLVGLARAFATMATAAQGTSEALLRDAMRSYPRLIGGTGRAVTELTVAVDGLLCKDGAEAVWGAALSDGRAFAVKAEDGGARTLPPLLAAALRYWGIEDETVRRWSSVDVLGGGVSVGRIGWSPALVELLSL